VDPQTSVAAKPEVYKTICVCRRMVEIPVERGGKLVQWRCPDCKFPHAMRFEELDLTSGPRIKKEETMGNYTRYELTVNVHPQQAVNVDHTCPTCKHSSRKSVSLIQQIRDTQLSDEEDMNCGDLLDGNSAEMKWYDYDRDMLSLSMSFPMVLFTLTGDPEEGPNWTTYYKHGKKQDAEIIVEPFDEAKLK
jgi:rubredoxin